MPSVTRKWKCPIHADHAKVGGDALLEKMRSRWTDRIIPDIQGLSKPLKAQKTVRVKDPQMSNNGDIDIIPSDRHRSGKIASSELISQGIRYQIPEQIVILDFWSKVRRNRYGQ
jgi:hypothetical protein